jgi:hypothetical protein
MGQLGNQPAGSSFKSEDVLRIMRELWAEYVTSNSQLFSTTQLSPDPEFNWALDDKVVGCEECS